VTAVQSRIAEIQQRFVLGTKTTSKANWASAAASAGLSGTDTDYATASAGTASEQGVVSEASKYLGVPYRWGGTDASTGLDCSGLTQLVYKNLGIDLPRTASQQATSGQAVASLADARPGDLVFFDYSSSRPGVDHVGIYVGNGKMIAAPQPGEAVKVQDVGNPAVIRRVLPAQVAVPAAAAPAHAADRRLFGFWSTRSPKTMRRCLAEYRGLQVVSVMVDLGLPLGPRTSFSTLVSVGATTVERVT
jgi:cell wall-associated NlpC family hydrolase